MMIPISNNRKITNNIRKNTVMFVNYKNETYNNSIVSFSNTGTDIKTPHEEGNCIYFLLTLFLYLIKSNGKKYSIENNTTNIL